MVEVMNVEYFDGVNVIAVPVIVAIFVVIIPVEVVVVLVNEVVVVGPNWGRILGKERESHCSKEELFLQA